MVFLWNTFLILYTVIFHKRRLCSFVCVKLCKNTFFKLKKYKLLYKTCFFDTFMDTNGLENMLAVHKNRFINSNLKNDTLTWDSQYDSRGNSVWLSLALWGMLFLKGHRSRTCIYIWNFIGAISKISFVVFMITSKGCEKAWICRSTSVWIAMFKSNWIISFVLPRQRIIKLRSQISPIWGMCMS